MEGVAEADEGVGLKSLDRGGGHRQGLAGVVTRRELAGRDGVGRAFLQVQVGHRQQSLGGPMQRACRQCLQPLARALEVERAHGWITTRAQVGTSDQTSRISASVTATQPLPSRFSSILRSPLNTSIRSACTSAGADGGGSRPRRRITATMLRKLMARPIDPMPPPPQGAPIPPLAPFLSPPPLLSPPASPPA